MSEQEEVVVYDQGEGNDKAIVEQINARLNTELADPKVLTALLATTFAGLKSTTQVKQALMEGMIRGFSFEDFLHKHVYAIPYGDKYSLVTSIDHARKRGMRNGVVGSGAPEYTYTDDKKTKVESCSVTIKRLIPGTSHVGEFTATVDFKEYTTGRNLWSSKPKTMIAKVAEMHALRKACPDELAQYYSEEEMHKEAQQPNRWSVAKEDSKTLKMGSVKTNNATSNEGQKDQKNKKAEAGKSDADSVDEEG